MFAVNKSFCDRYHDFDDFSKKVKKGPKKGLFFLPKEFSSRTGKKVGFPRGVQGTDFFDIFWCFLQKQKIFYNDQQNFYDVYHKKFCDRYEKNHKNVGFYENG